MRYTSDVIFSAKKALVTKSQSDPTKIRKFFENELELKEDLENTIKSIAQNCKILVDSDEYEALLSSVMYGFSLRGELDRVIASKAIQLK